MERTPKAYWDGTWVGMELPPPLDVRSRKLSHTVERGYHKFFSSLFAEGRTAGRPLLEIGCARSQWLPYFAEEYGFRVEGIDYSEKGCRLAEGTLARAGAEGRIVCGDFLSPPDEMLDRYDVVVSFGVLEHFEDSRSCLQAFAAFLKPGGTLITFIPNLVGFNGAVMKRLSREVYDLHVPLSREDLAQATEGAGLVLEECRYFLLASFNVVEVGHLRPRPVGTVLRYLLWWASKSLWMAQRAAFPSATSPFLSPYILCLARKPGV
jgi:SAM-dependent methyltransferase